jgi:hypothetical protein
MQHDQVPGDREAKAKPSMFAGRGGVRLAKWLEEMRDEVRSKPMPVSVTVTVTFRGVRVVRTVTVPSRGVNLTAFDSTFDSTCWRRCGSALMVPMSRDSSATSRTPRAPA